MAVCLPVLFAIVFGAIQTCDVIHLRHVTTLAAYEGTLAASKSNGTRSSVLQRAETLLDAVGVTGGVVTLEPNVANLADLAEGQHVAVVVTAPVSGNLTGPTLFSTVSEVQSRAVTSR